MSDTRTAQLAAFAAGLRFEDIPPHVVRKAFAIFVRFQSRRPYTVCGKLFVFFFFIARHTDRARLCA